LLNDSSTVRAALQDSLSDCGYEAILARDGDEAWRIISQADAPHICILDWVMPGMTGVEICKKLRLLPEREYRYVLLLTSRGTKEEVIEGLEAGADDYLVKPISPPEIQARLRSAQRILQLQDGLTAECRTVLEEKQRIRLLLDSTAEGILGVDRTGRCTFCNRAALAEFGYDSESQILGKDIHSAAHHTRPDGTPCPTEECRFFSALFKEQPTHFTDDHYWHQDGTQFPVENWSYPIRGEDGVVGAVLTFWNTTDRRNAEDARRRSEQLFRAMAENSADLIAVVDPQGRMIYSNPAHRTVLGLTPAELQRTVVFDHIHPDDRQGARQIFEEALGSGEGPVAEFRMRRKDGTYITLESHGNYIRNSRGEIETIVFSSRDVGQRRSVEQEQKLLAIGQLAAGVAHEINSPLQFVSDNILFLRQALDQFTPVVDFCCSHKKDAKNNCALPQSLVSSSDLEWTYKEIPSAISQSQEGLQRISKIVAGMRTFSHSGVEGKTLVDINGALDSALTLAWNEIKHVAEVETSFASDLPKATCLAGGINQVFLNLIVNATHAIADAVAQGLRTKGTLGLRTLVVEHDIQIEIHDNGTGIANSIRDRVFEPFFTTKPVGKGTGQGLAICFDIIVNKHQGRIWFDSESGQGTTFFVRIPIVQ
jgi:PAS domain S-box-containing protein